MKEIIGEDECNDTYGRIQMYQALLLKQPEGVHIPSEAGFPFRCPIRKMYYRYHRNPGIQWETACICDFSLL